MKNESPSKRQVKENYLGEHFRAYKISSAGASGCDCIGYSAQEWGKDTEEEERVVYFGGFWTMGKFCPYCDILYSDDDIWCGGCMGMLRSVTQEDDVAVANRRKSTDVVTLESAPGVEGIDEVVEGVEAKKRAKAKRKAEAVKRCRLKKRQSQSGEKRRPGRPKGSKRGG